MLPSISYPVKKEACCRKSLPAFVTNDRFGADCHCPETMPAERFSSPNSPLPPKKLKRLQRRIEAVNDLLQSSGVEKPSDNPNLLRLQVRRLRGFGVRVKAGGSARKKKFKGILQEAGRDFLRLKAKDASIFIPFRSVCSIRMREDDTKPNDKEQELIGMNLERRRALVLRFGEVVSHSPYLINVFFGISLHRQLNALVGEKVTVATEARRRR